MTAEIIPLRRPDHDTYSPGWYVDMTQQSGGIGSIYVHTDTGAWVRGGRQLDAREVPAGLKKLGVAK